MTRQSAWQQKRYAPGTPTITATYFGFRKITFERPLGLDFQASPEGLARLDDEQALVDLDRVAQAGGGQRPGWIRRAGRSRPPSAPAPAPAGHAVPRPGGLREGAFPGRSGSETQARRAHPKGHPLGDEYRPPRPLEAIEADIQVEKEIVAVPREMTVIVSVTDCQHTFILPT